MIVEDPWREATFWMYVSVANLNQTNSSSINMCSAKDMLFLKYEVSDH